MIEGQSAGNENTRREGQVLAAQADDYCPFALPLYWDAFIGQGESGPLGFECASAISDQQRIQIRCSLRFGFEDEQPFDLCGT
jgi:hypothetical protein